MLFRNLMLFRLSPEITPDLQLLEEGLANHPLPPCGALDMAVHGWVNPRHEGLFSHTVNGQWLIALGHDTKVLPAAVIQQAARREADHIAEETGLPVSRKQMREIKERVTEELLAKAFTRQTHTLVWIDPINRWIGVNASNATRGDLVAEKLSRAINEIWTRRVEPRRSPMSAMTGWVAEGEAPSGFTIDQDLELRAPEENSGIRYTRHNLDGDEIKQHIAAGKMATKLALTWRDKVSFVLTEEMQIKRLTFLDVLKEKIEADSPDAEAEFDVAMTIMTGELSQLLADLMAALDGDMAMEVRDEKAA